MKRVAQSDLMSLGEYELRRPELLARAIELKKHRRVSVGDRITLLFENRDTVLFQVHEMLRIERIAAPERIQEELDIYNATLPGKGELSATLFIEITENRDIRRELERLRGLHRHVALRFGSHVVRGRFEGGREREEGVSSVQYVRFRFTPAQRKAFVREPEARLEVSHPRYRRSAVLPPDVRESLAGDLQR